MDQLIKTFKNMMGNCIAYLRKDETVWNDEPEIRTDLEDLERINTELDNTINDQGSNNSSSPIAAKNELLKSLGNRFYKLSRRLTLFATKTKNVALLKIVDLSETTLLIGDEDKIKIHFNTLLNSAKKHLNELAKYKIDTQYLDDLETSFNELKKMPKTISTVKENHKIATRSLKEIAVDARVALENLDNAIEGFVEDDSYIAGWFDVRKIKGRRNYKKGKDGDNTDTPEPQ